MGAYKAKLTVPGVFDWPLAVEIDLNEGRMAISTGTGEIGAWNIDDVEVRGREDGFELRAEGDVILFSTVDDGRFAVEVGLHLPEINLLREEPPVRRFPATSGLREQFKDSIDGAVKTTAEHAGDDVRVEVAGTGPRPRRGRHQRRGKGRHLRSVAG
jgi:hypothetical protein